MKRKRTNLLLIAVATIIHIFFYISAFDFHFLDYFFNLGDFRIYQGIDFFQVPNGAYMFLRGASLTGASLANLPTYAYGNYNVYHPFFTLLVGSFFILFTPHNAFITMMIIKIVITLFTIYFLYKNFSKNPYFPIALFIFLTFFPQYLELWSGQYHFFLTISLLFLLYYLLKNKKDTLLSGFLLFLNLLIKPIGFLWIPICILNKKWKTLIFGISLFFVVTIPFLINKTGNYFVDNLIERFRSPIGGPPQVFTLDAIARFYNFSFYNGTLVKGFILLLFLYLIIRYRISLFSSLFIMTSFYLLFYDLVFEYHYTVLIPFFVLGILVNKIFRNKLAIILILSFSFPTPFFIFHFFQTFTKEYFMADQGWTIIVLFRILPLIVLTILVLTKEIKNYFKSPQQLELQNIR